MRYVVAVVGIFVLVVSVIVCGDPDGEPGTRSFLVVVEGSLHEPLRASLEQYAETMALERYEVHVQPFVPQSVDEGDHVWELRDFLFEFVDSHGIEGALLIGDLPKAMYEMPVALPYDLEALEEFPTDIFLQDRDAWWADNDHDNVIEQHGELEADIYTSRLIGTTERLVAYFARLERYRREGPLVDSSAFIFIDDDWHRMDTSDAFLLGKLYGEIEVVKDRAESSREYYLEKLTGDGAEFVYQWVHAAPPKPTDEEDKQKKPAWLAFEDGVAQPKLWANDIGNDIGEHNLKVSFVNMADCYAARLEDEELSLASAYTVGTDYGLATIGSSKTGAQTNPRLFHESLARGLSWGEAYKVWYNQEGKKNDLWHLGIILMGDPLLRVPGGSSLAGSSPEMN
ncbi:MAG: C25 family cysteine peptidase [Polyangiales bacterium]